VRAVGAISLIALTACASRPAATADKSAATARGVAPEAWAYEVEVPADGRTLDVTATFPTGSGSAFELDDAAPFTEKVEWRAPASTGTWQGATLRDRAWLIACAAGCDLRYRVRMGDAARALRDMDSAMEVHGAIESTPSTWILRPTDFDPRSTYRFHVHTGGDVRFATGVRPVPGAPDTYGGRAIDLESAPYTVFGKLRTRALVRTGTTIEVATLEGALALDDAAIDRWIDLAVRAVDAYYGHFPVSRLLLVVAPIAAGHEAVEGRTLANGGAAILLGVSEHMTAEEIPRDWVLTHEMIHLTSPALPREQHWLEEGIATYVEPIARAEVGTIAPEEVWRGLVDGLPNGEPGPGDQGLDNTHTWGRTYWGGAMFCFLADLEIRKRTGNRASLETALRGVLDGLGSGEIRASVDDLLRAGDRATGVPVLEELHTRLGGKAETVDLAALWSELGVRDAGGKITFDDAAPATAIRRSIGARK
jgi:hypothetical protein